MSHVFDWSWPADAQAGAPLSVWIGQTAGYDPSVGSAFSDQLNATRDWLETRYGDCRVTHLSVYVGTAAGNMRLGLYADDGTEKPGALIAETAEFAPSPGWNTVPVVSEEVISPGTYWVAFLCSSGACEIGTQSSSGLAFTNGARQADPQAYGALPATFPAGGAQFDDYHWSVYATLESLSLSQPAAPAAPAEPAAISGQGYSLVFQDEFDFYDRLKWNNLIWYDSPPFEQDTIYCQDSVLHLLSKKPPGWVQFHAYSLTNISTLGRTHFEEGYFECRMRWPAVVGAWPAFWLISRDWAELADCLVNVSAELDVMEGTGDDTVSYQATAHSDSANVCSVNQQSPDNWQTPGGAVAGQWHTYGALWTATEIKWYFDDVLVLTLPIGPGTNWDTFAGNPQQLLAWSWTHSLDGGYGTEVDGSVDPLDTEIDWIRVWQL